MSDPDRIVSEFTYMRDALTDPPPVGMRVHALNQGGVMVQAVWTSESQKFFEAWHPYLKIPKTVKDRMSKRHANELT